MWFKRGANSERRSGRRVHTSMEAGLAVMDAMTRRHLTPQGKARVEDLSERGCRLAVDTLNLDGFQLGACRDFPQDYRLELCLAPPGGGTWRVGANLVWINHDLEGPPFKLGIKFEDPVALPGSFQRLLRAAEA